MAETPSAVVAEIVGAGKHRYPLRTRPYPMSAFAHLRTRGRSVMLSQCGHLLAC